MPAAPLARIHEFLDDLLQPTSSSDAEGNGLQVTGRQFVRSLGAGLSTSFTVIDSAAASAVDLLLVHHAPWSAVDLHLRQRKLSRLDSLGISLYAAHETLDRVANLGFARTLAALLDLEVAIEPGEGMVVGSVEEHDLESWLAFISKALQTPVRAWPNNRTFRRVAIVPGASSSTQHLAAAARLGCDTLLTGEGSLYTELFAREVGITLVYASHTATEFPQICSLASRCASEFGLPWVALPEATDITGGGKAPLQYGW